MNKRQRKKRFKKSHGMNPNQYFLEKGLPEITYVKFVIKSPDGLIRMMCKANGKFYEISRMWVVHANLLKNLTEQRKQGKRKKGKWSK